MKNIVSSLYAEYGRYIDSFRAIPKHIDCLKPVERRLLLSVHQIARNKLQKSAKVIGACLSYHPHGDSSTYSALVGLVQRGFVEGQGNWGKVSYPEDDKAAAYRYTECKAVDALHSVFEKYLNFVPWEVLEIEKEPVYIPFPIPIGLIGSGLITGIGFHTTKIPRYNFGDLLKRLIELLENNPNKTTIIPYCADCVITEDSPGEFENILTLGHGKINIIPNTKVEAHRVSVYGKNPAIGFNGLRKFNETYEDNNGIPYFDVLDYKKYDTPTAAHLEITPVKSSFVNKQFSDKIIELVSSSENIKVNVVDDNNTVYQTGIDNLLLNAYEKWKKVNLTYLENDLEKVESKINELTIIIIVRDIVRNHPDLLKDKKLSDIVQYNNSQYSDSELVRVCNKHNIKTLIESHIDINSLIKQQTDLKSKIKDIDNYVLKKLKIDFGL